MIALGNIGPEARAAVPTLVQVLRTPDSAVRIEAARFGPEAGMIGAALFAREVADGRPTGAIEGRPGGAT